MVQVLLKSVRLLFPSADKADSGQSPKAGGEPQAGAVFVTVLIFAKQRASDDSI
jgi:hypothetical protein